MSFVNNEEFYNLLKEYKETKETNPKRNKEVHDRLGEIFLIMGKNLLYRHNFINYTKDWKDEMLSDGCFNCCRYIDSFDVDKNSSPFAYFSQVLYFSYVQVLNKEKKIKFQREKVVEEIWNGIDFNDCEDTYKGQELM